MYNFDQIASDPVIIPPVRAVWLRHPLALSGSRDRTALLWDLETGHNWTQLNKNKLEKTQQN